MSAPDLIGLLIDRAEDEQLFASHAAAYETLKTDHPDLLREIEAESMRRASRSSTRFAHSTDRGS